jgi:NAD(P)-dependent dehydrogenase (short-subunit alcohol dehydrogenase family)
MDSFEDKLAVVTGGGTGMGRELARQLAAAGCHVAMCDVSEENMQETRELCRREGPAGLRVTTHLADVSVRTEVDAFRNAVVAEHETDYINLLFNNAGIGGAGSFLLDGEEEWEKTFGVCWNGVYFGSRAFMPLLVASDEGHIVNTSSVNGFWASLGPQTAHTSYSAAKFAVKGFTEALVNDCRLNAPHVGVSLVMPGHIGTSIVINSGKILGFEPKELTDDQVDDARGRVERMMNVDMSGATNEQIKLMLQARAEQFRDEAPTSAADAARVILDGVRDKRWRILIGDDAHAIDRMVRESPEEAYEAIFFERLLAETNWELGS